MPCCHILLLPLSAVYATCMNSSFLRFIKGVQSGQSKAGNYSGGLKRWHRPENNCCDLFLEDLVCEPNMGSTALETRTGETRRQTTRKDVMLRFAEQEERNGSGIALHGP